MWESWTIYWLLYSIWSLSGAEVQNITASLLLREIDDDFVMNAKQHVSSSSSNEFRIKNCVELWE